MAETKTQKAVCLLRAGDLKGALKIFRTFRVGFSSDEKRTIGIACECLCGNDGFYSSLGVDCCKIVDEAVAIAVSYKHSRAHVTGLGLRSRPVLEK